MRRILSLDGGGIGGLFTLQVLARIQQLFRLERGRPDLVLREVFDFFAGTSTGAIIATALAWGMTVEAIESLYLDNGAAMFAKQGWHRRWWGWYRSDTLAALFRREFCEDTPDRPPALLGTRKLWIDDTTPRYLLVVIRNASTGSPWPITNNPEAIYNDPARADCNLQIPLWKLLRASTAAPTYFAPAAIDLGHETHIFVDGGITPFNNPALIAILTATLPCYRIQWPTGPDRLLVVSVGTCLERIRFAKTEVKDIHYLDQARHVAPALLSSISQEQDMLCRLLGDPLFGAPIDSEMGDLTGSTLLGRAERKFGYVRYNREVTRAEAEQLRLRTRQSFTLDNVGVMPFLKEIGQQYAEATVRREHLGLSPNAEAVADRSSALHS